MLSARMRWASVHRPDQLSRRSASSLLVESISDAIEGLDCIEFGVGGAELAPDSLDVTVDGAVVDINIVTIRNIEQLIASFDDAGTLGQRFQDQELGHREADVLTVPAHLVAGRVHHQPAA